MERVLCSESWCQKIVSAFPSVRSSGADTPGLTFQPIFTIFFLFDRVFIDLKTKILFFRKKIFAEIRKKLGVGKFFGGGGKFFFQNFFLNFFWIAFSFPYSGHVKF